MGTIYHYTDVNGLFEIITKKKLWLSGVTNLNDYAEINWTTDLFNRLTEGFNYLGEEKKIVEELARSIKANLVERFICSFSKERDALSQWRAYADNGHGFAIGFNTDCFPDVDRLNEGHIHNPHEVSLYEVIYDESQQLSELETIIDRLIFDLKNLTAGDIGFNVFVSAWQIIQKSAIYKQRAFGEEREVRLVCHPSDPRFNARSYKPSEKYPLRQRVSKKRICTYMEYELEKPNDYIVEVVKGPKCEVSDFDLELLLQLNGLTSFITKSAATYR